MRRLLLPISVVLVVPCLIISGVIVGLRRSLPGFVPLARGMSQANKLFPKPPVLLEYERIGDQYAAGRIEQELPNVRKLSVQPICLGSAHAWASDTNVYYYSFMPGRLMPACAIIRRIGYDNCDYAAKLCKAGRSKESLSALLINISIARQLVHMEPQDTGPLLSGVGLWKTTWTQIAHRMELLGDKARAKRAAECAHRSVVYLKTQVGPRIDREGQRLKMFEHRRGMIPKGILRNRYERRMNAVLLREASVDAELLVKQWDAEVDTAASKQLIKELEQISCRVSTH